MPWPVRLARRDEKIASINDDHLGVKLRDPVVIVTPAVDVRNWHIVRPSRS